MNPARATIAAIAASALLVAALAACGGGGSGETVSQDTATQGAVEEPNTEQPLSAAEEHGRGLFVQNCGSCHTLDAAGTIGQIGPNLGDIPLNEADVRGAIARGGAPGDERSGNMPANLVTGKDAADVARFVSASGPGASTP
jgi:mono/diheme cytochrome c family protein